MLTACRFFVPFRRRSFLNFQALFDIPDEKFSPRWCYVWFQFPVWQVVALIRLPIRGPAAPWRLLMIVTHASSNDDARIATKFGVDEAIRFSKARHIQ
jgi:hypothetical protein